MRRMPKVGEEVLVLRQIGLKVKRIKARINWLEYGVTFLEETSTGGGDVIKGGKRIRGDTLFKRSR